MTRADAILAYLVACQPRTPKQLEIQLALGLGRGTVYDGLQRLVREGRIARARYGRVIEVRET